MNDVPAPSACFPHADLRAGLVRELERSGCLRSAALREAFLRVPRHAFLPGAPPAEVYSDRSLDLKSDPHGLTSSSTPPGMMAIMLEQLDVRPGDRCLEIGTASGYDAALLSRLVGPEGRVTTVELDPDLARDAARALDEAGCRDVRVVLGDGGEGFAEGAPYDRVLVTAAATEILPSWRDQLAEGGRLVVPLELRLSQASVAFEARGAHLESLSVACCSFVPLRGRHAAPSARRRLPLPGLRGACLETACSSVEPATVARHLARGGVDRPSGVRISVADYFFGLRLWLELHEPQFSELSADARGLESVLVPALTILASPRPSVLTGFLPSGDGLAALVDPGARAGGAPGPNDLGGELRVFDVHVRAAGSDPEPAERLLHRVRSWDAAGRPFQGVSDALDVLACRSTDGIPPGRAREVLERGACRLALSW
jgi:protein-L-isoaspartate(D-aspartate) O-methyltransferase